MADLMLDSLRVLDLTDEKGFFCGRILGSLGADVIKVEKPGGDAARSFAPFYKDIPGPERSLYWLAFNANKRGMTLNLETEEGREIFRKLVPKVDIIIESFTPGYLDSLGLDYEHLSEINPRIILTSVTPFGQTGPYRDRPASDLILFALSGLAHVIGDEDKPPLRYNLDQSYILASSEAAVGTLLALRFRKQSGVGDHVDVSAYELLVRSHYRDPQIWEYYKRVPRRQRNMFAVGSTIGKATWQCRDGYIAWYLTGGATGAGQTYALVELMDKEGIAGSLKDVKWEEVDTMRTPQEVINQWGEAVAEFFKRHTKKELEQLAAEKGIRLGAVLNMKDVYENEHFKERDIWAKVEHADGGELVYPGRLFLSDQVDATVRLRPPLLGEHNREIYKEELGLSDEELGKLKSRGVI